MNSKLTLTLHPLLVVGALLAVAPFTQAQTQNPLLVFTEYSDTVLTATINGVATGTVHYKGSSDRWEWDSGVAATFIGTLASAWQEPGNEQGANWFLPARLANADAGLNVFSDTNLLFIAALSHNGAIIPSDLTITTPSGNTTTYDVEFLDLGDTASVPDSTSTFRLITLSTLGLLGVRRLRSARAC